MPQQGFDVNAARQAGYSDDEILSHLTATRNFDVSGAVSSGYSKGEIIDHLSGSPAQAPDFAANPPGVPRPNVPMDTMLTPSEFGNRLRNSPNPGVSEGAGLREGLSDYVTSSAGNIGGGVKDIAQGNVSRGTHRVIQGAGNATVPALPFLAPLLAANPAVAGRVVGGGLLGQLGASKGAELLGASPDQAQLAGDVGGLAGGYGAGKLPGFLSRFAPSTLKAGAGAALNAASQAAGNEAVPVTNELSNSLTDFQDLAERGGTNRVAVSKLIQRVTKPDADPLTYDEARDWYSNISRLSADDFNRMSAAQQRQVGTIRNALGDAIQQTAAKAGVGQQYSQGMNDYRLAMQREEMWQNVWSAVKKNALPYLVKGAAAGVGGRIAYDIYKGTK